MWSSCIIPSIPDGQMDGLGHLRFVSPCLTGVYVGFCWLMGGDISALFRFIGFRPTQPEVLIESFERNVTLGV